MKEYGGYFPIELIKRQEYYNGPNVVQLNCGRSAIIYACQEGNFKRVLLPIYLCESVSIALEKFDIEHKFYNIDESFNPIGLELEEHDILLYPNYFGVVSSQNILRLVDKYKNVIVDNTQAFFQKPILNAYNVYSCRKFFGVSDGAYLIKKGLKSPKLETDQSYQRSGFLLKAIELSTNEAYRDSLLNEQIIADSGILLMSRLTQSMLNSIDYESTMEKRSQNLECLDRMIGHLNKLSITLSNVVPPMVYPFLFKNRDFRQYLINNKIYVPQWWKSVLNHNRSNDFEKSLSEFLFPLPIDQRYDTSDMEHIAKIVLDFYRIENIPR